MPPSSQCRCRCSARSTSTPIRQPALQAAIEELRYGHGVKTILQYEKGFRARGSVASDLSFQAASIAGNRVVTAYTTGRNGLLYGTISKHTRPLLVADELGEVYPGSRGRYLLGESVLVAYGRLEPRYGSRLRAGAGDALPGGDPSAARPRPLRRRAHRRARRHDGRRRALGPASGSRDHPRLVVTRSGDSNPKSTER